MITLCVLLWARESQEARLVAYEDRVLQLLSDHGGHVLQRARTSGLADGPLEIHILSFTSEQAFDGFMADERRAAMSDERDVAVERTEVFRVDLV